MEFLNLFGVLGPFDDPVQTLRAHPWECAQACIQLQEPTGVHLCKNILKKMTQVVPRNLG